MKNMRVKQILLAAAFLTGGTFAAEAQESAAMTFIDNALNPRMAAMGGVMSGLSADAYAQFGNIAAVPHYDDTFSAGVSYSAWQPTASASNVGILGAIYKTGRFGVSVGASASINAPYMGMDDYGVPTGKYTPTDWRVGAGVSYLITDDFSAGLGLNYASSKISAKYPAYYTAFASLQLMYRIEDFSISLSGNNLGLPVSTHAGNKFDIPMNGELSVAYANSWDEHELSAVVDGRMYFGGPLAAGGSVGAEYGYDSLVYVRAGYHYASVGNGIPSFASAGLGFRFFGVNIDAAYLFGWGNSPLKHTFTVGVGYSF